MLKVSKLNWASVPALRQRAPLSVVLANVPQTEGDRPRPVELVDCSYERDEDAVTAVGTVLRLAAESPRTDTAEQLAALAPFHPSGEVKTHTVRATNAEVEAVPGVLISGKLDSSAHLARAFVCAPHPNLVLSVVAARRVPSGGLADPAALDEVFDELLAGVVLDPTLEGASSEPWWFTSRAMFCTGGVPHVDEGFALVGGTASDDGIAQYLECPAGLYEALGVKSDVITLDARGAFCFDRAWAKRHKPEKMIGRLEGYDQKVPLHRWSSDETSGIAFVVDGVMHLLEVTGETEEAAAKILGTLRFTEPGLDVHRLLVPKPVRVASTFHPMPAKPVFSRRR